MSVSAATSISNFMALHVESQGRTTATLSSTEEAALQDALGQFQLGTTQLAEVDKLLDALQVMRGMMVAGSLSYTALDSIELSIQMLLQAAVTAPAMTTGVQAAAPLPANVQAFSDQYLTSSYLPSASVWPGADTRLQADLATFDLAPREVSVATQYMYDIADQRRYLAAIDAALQAPDGFLYATPTQSGYPAYLDYLQARANTATRIDADVATVQGILAGTVNVWEASFDPIPWSLVQTDPQAAVPPSNAMDQARFELAEDKLLLGQLATQGRAIEGQITQLTSVLSAKTLPPLAQEQIFLYTTQVWDLKRQLKLVNAERAALQVRVNDNNAVVAGTMSSADSGLKADLDVTVAQGKLAAFAPTPVNTGPSDPVPTSALQAQLSADQAASTLLIQAPPPPPPAPGQPPTLPTPTLQLIEGYMSQLTYQMDVPVGMQLTTEQTDELKLLWAHRAALGTQYQALKTELDALRARMDYAQAVLDGWKPYQTSEWNRLTAAVDQARLRREAGETLPPTSGALVTPPVATVAWKLSGSNPAHMQVTRIENFLLTGPQNDWVYEQFDQFAATRGMVADDTQTAAIAKTAVQAAISDGLTGTQLTNAQRQLSALNALIAMYPTFAEDADIAYDHAESARTVTDFTQVDAELAAVEASLETIQQDDAQVAEQKMRLADANLDYHYPSGGTAPNAVYLQAISNLAINLYGQKQYTYLAAIETNPTTQAAYQATLAGYEEDYPDLLTATLAAYFDAAYEAASSGEWPRTLSSSLTPQEKADEVSAYYGGNVYALIDPVHTTVLPASVT